MEEEKKEVVETKVEATETKVEFSDDQKAAIKAIFSECFNEFKESLKEAEVVDKAEEKEVVKVEAAAVAEPVKVLKHSPETQLEKKRIVTKPLKDLPLAQRINQQLGETVWNNN
jgi:hypothetical protein